MWARDLRKGSEGVLVLFPWGVGTGRCAWQAGVHSDTGLQLYRKESLRSLAGDAHGRDWHASIYSRAGAEASRVLTR